MLVKTLRDYQCSVVNNLRKSSDHVLIEQPTGAGKTIEIVALAAYLLRRGLSVLIATTQEHIEHGFTRRDYETVYNVKQAVSVPAELVRGARDGPGVIASVCGYMAQASPTYALVCTHSALTRVRPPTGIPAGAGRVLIIDEAQHAPALGLSQFVTAWLATGSRLLYFTATAYRADEEPVVIPGMRVVRRTLPQHISAGFAPQELGSEIIAIHSPQAISDREFHGDIAPPKPLHQRMVGEMVKHWQAANKPKTIIRVPPLRGGSGELVEAIVKRFEKVGARVLNVAGDNREARKRFLTELVAERSVSRYADSRYDVVVGVQRVAEGMDWPLCSDVYCVGLPLALSTTVQLLGRATRLKLKDHPATHRDRAKITFFVPAGDSATLLSLPAHHSRRALLLCSCLANGLGAQEWAAVQQIGRGVVARLGGGGDGAEAVSRDYPYLDPELRANAELSLAEAQQTLSRRGRYATAAECLEQAYLRRPDLGRSVIRQVLIELVVAETGSSADRVRHDLCEEINGQVSRGAGYREAIITAFDSVLLPFEEEVVANSRVLRNLRSQLVVLTADNVTRFARMLENVRPLRPEWLSPAIQEFFTRTGYWPNAHTPGRLADWPSESWAAIDRDIRGLARQWPLPEVRSLKEFVAKYHLVQTVGDLLELFMQEVPVTPVERVFVEHLLNLSVRVHRVGSVTTFGQVPMHRLPRALVAPLGLLRYWLLKMVACTPPTAAVFAANVVANFEQWLARRQPGQLGFSRDAGYHSMLDSRQKAQITTRIAGITVHCEVPPGRDYVFRYWSGQVLLRPGTKLWGKLGRCHLSSTSGEDAAAVVPVDAPDKLVDQDTVRNDLWAYSDPELVLAIPVRTTPAGLELADPDSATDGALVVVPAQWATHQDVYSQGVMSPATLPVSPTDWRATLAAVTCKPFGISAGGLVEPPKDFWTDNS